MVMGTLGRSVAQASWLSPNVGRRPVLVLHSSSEPGELAMAVP